MTRYLARHAVCIVAVAPLMAGLELGRRIYATNDDARFAVLAQDVLSHGFRLFPDLNGVPYLTTAEIKDFAGASAAEKPTDADTQKIAALKRESAKRAEDYQLLSSKKEADITPAERTRLSDACTEHGRLRVHRERGQVGDARRRQIMDHDAGRARIVRVCGRPVPQRDAIPAQGRYERARDDQHAPPAQHVPVVDHFRGAFSTVESPRWPLPASDE